MGGSSDLSTLQNSNAPGKTGFTPNTLFPSKSVSSFSAPAKPPINQKQMYDGLYNSYFDCVKGGGTSKGPNAIL